MARVSSRKSTKVCPKRSHGRKAHMRKGKQVKATCVKNRASRGRKMRGIMDKIKEKSKAAYASAKQKYQEMRA